MGGLVFSHFWTYNYGEIHINLDIMLQQMKNRSKLKSLTRSITGIFVTKKSNFAQSHDKSRYFQHYYFKESLCIGIALVAEQRRCSKKAAAEHLMEAGISQYMGELVGNELHAQRLANERGERYRSRFLMLLKRYARAQGFDLTEFLKNKI
jgi:hypothetical protein